MSAVDPGVASSLSAAPDWAGEFFDFWPTVIVQRRLPECEGPNRSIAALASAMERGDPNLTTNYKGIDLFSADHEGIRWLRGHIDQTVVAYLAHHDMRYPIRWTLQGWPNINRRGDYHSPHNHGWCYLSGTYYVQMPPEETGEEIPQGAKPGCISFYDPRGAVNMLGFSGPEEGPEYTVRPTAGTLLLWHAAINHFVHPNLSSTERVSVSFNVVLEWANHYLANE